MWNESLELGIGLGWGSCQLKGSEKPWGLSDTACRDGEDEGCGAHFLGKWEEGAELSVCILLAMEWYLRCPAK